MADAHGELNGDQGDLDCRTCTDEDKVERGCGVAPLVPHWSTEFDGRYLGRRLWTLEHFYAQAEAREFEPDANAAFRIGYRWADYGGWVELLGNPPECCPRYPLEFADPRARDLVSRAVRLANWSENGNLQAIAQLPLIPAMVDLIDLVQRARARHQRIQLENRKTDSETEED